MQVSIFSARKSSYFSFSLKSNPSIFPSHTWIPCFLCLKSRLFIHASNNKPYQILHRKSQNEKTQRRLQASAGDSASTASPCPRPLNSEISIYSSVRFKIVFLVALSLMLCNADRVIMSVAILPLSVQNGWGEGMAGIVQSSFLWGYALTPIIGGSLADNFGGKHVLAAGIGLWSLATCLTPLAASSSFLALLAVRAIMGLGEGVALPCMNNILGKWVPASERGRAVSFCFCGFHFGSILGLVVAPMLITRLGSGITWLFLTFGLAGLVWFIFWQAFASSQPQQHPNITSIELNHILNRNLKQEDDGDGEELRMRMVVCAKAEKDGEKQRDRRKVNGDLQKTGNEDAKKETTYPPFRLLLSKFATWALIVANMVNNWGYFVLLSWMPVYFTRVLGVSIRSAAWFSAIPWLSMAIFGIFSGFLADYLIYLNFSITKVRKIMQSFGFFGPCVSIFALMYAKNCYEAATFLSLALGFSAFSQSGFLVNYQDIGPKYAGVLHGISNTAGTLAGIWSTIFSGFLLEKFGSFQAVLAITSLVYAFGGMFWLIFSTGEKLFD